VTIADLAIIAALIFVGRPCRRAGALRHDRPIVFTAAGLVLPHGLLRPLGIEPSPETVKVLAEATASSLLRRPLAP
jgi:hypothetical protein